jgi:hypothetical protein
MRLVPYRAVLNMTPAFQSETTVFLYASVADPWIDDPVQQFISAPSSGSRYWTHPRAETK